MEALLERLGVAVIYLEEGDRIAACNAAFVRMAGLDEPPLGQSLAAMLAPEHRECLDQAACEERVVQWAEHPSGTAPMLLTLIPIGQGRLALLNKVRMTDDDVLRAMSHLNDEMVALSRELQRKNTELRKAQENIKVLSGMIPICASCKRIRSDTGYWSQVEEYITLHSEAVFSHGMCPDCMRRLYPDMMDDDDEAGGSV